MLLNNYWKNGIEGINGIKGIEGKNGTFEQTCLRKPHEWVVGRIVGANNSGIVERFLTFILHCSVSLLHVKTNGI